MRVFGGAAALLLLGFGCAPQTPPTETAQAEELAVTAKQWAFEPAEIRVKKGDRVRLVITSVDVDHGFALPAFGVNVTLAPGRTETVEFTADRTGSFAFFCTVYCGAGHQDMNGKLIVE